MNDKCERLERDAYCDNDAMSSWRMHADSCEDCAGKIRLYEMLIKDTNADRRSLTTTQRDSVLQAAANRVGGYSRWKSLLPIAAVIAIAIGVMLLWSTDDTPTDDGTPKKVKTHFEKDPDLAWNHVQVQESRKRLRFLAMMSSTDQAETPITRRTLRRTAERRKKYFGTHWTENQTKEK